MSCYFAIFRGWNATIFEIYAILWSRFFTTENSWNSQCSGSKINRIPNTFITIGRWLCFNFLSRLRIFDQILAKLFHMRVFCNTTCENIHFIPMLNTILWSRLSEVAIFRFHRNFLNSLLCIWSKNHRFWRTFSKISYIEWDKRERNERKRERNPP